MTSSSPPGKTPFLNFFAFLIAFGWEGPVIVSIGLRNHATLEIVIGVLFAAFFWGLFGLKLLLDLVRYVFKLKTREEVLAAKATVKSER